MTDYPLAKARMLEVWAKCECPVCDGELDHLCDDYEDDLHLDTYTCDYCALMVVYISQRKYHEYHEVPDSEKRYLIEQR